MRWVTGVILVVFGAVGQIVVLLPRLHAAASPALIVAIQTASQQSAGDEYIALANTTNQPVSLSSVQLQYFAAIPKSTTVPSRTLKLSGSLAAGELYELGSGSFAASSVDQTFSATLAASGGHLRLVGPEGEWDKVGWGTAGWALGSPAPAPPDDQLLQRKQVAGAWVNTANNQADFSVSTQSEDTPLEASQHTRGLQLSELLPDPAPPALDSKNEFIELQNTGNQTVSLAGLQLRVGSTSPKTYSLPQTQLELGMYRVFYAAQTKLTLSNSGGQVQLLAADGTILDQTTYPKAPIGAAWMRAEESWVWTTDPTPEVPNSLHVFEDAAESKSAKATAAKQKSSKVSKKKSASKAKTKKGTSVKAASTSQAVSAEVVQKRPVHNSVIAGVGGLAVLYGAYEYRHDALHLYRKLRGNRKTR